MERLDFDTTALDKLFPPSEGFFESTLESSVLAVPSIGEMPLQLTQPHNTYAEDGQSQILARMQAQDLQGGQADIWVVETGSDGRPQGYTFHMAFKGLPKQNMHILLTDRYGNQLQSAETIPINQMRMVNGVELYDGSMREISWKLATEGRSRGDRGTHPIGLFLGGYDHFQGGSIAIR